MFLGLVLALALLVGPRDPYYTGSILLRCGEHQRFTALDGTVQLETDRAEVTRSVVAAILSWSKPADPILVFPYSPMFYALASRKNLTRWDGFFPHLLDAPKSFEAVRRSLRDAAPAVVVLDEGIAFSDGSLSSREVRLIAMELQANYREVARFDPYVVMVPHAALDAGTSR